MFCGRVDQILSRRPKEDHSRTNIHRSAKLLLTCYSVPLTISLCTNRGGETLCSLLSLEEAPLE